MKTMLSALLVSAIAVGVFLTTAWLSSLSGSERTLEEVTIQEIDFAGPHYVWVDIVDLEYIDATWMRQAVISAFNSEYPEYEVQGALVEFVQPTDTYLMADGWLLKLKIKTAGM